jgi:hypothetical protein
MFSLIAIAERVWPQKFCRAAEGACYESFTLKGLSAAGRPSTLAPVMTARKPFDTASGRPCLADNSRPMSFSARKLLYLTSDFRNPTSEI